MIALNNKFMPKNDYVAEVRHAVLHRLDNFKLGLNTYTAYERFNDQALFLHAEEVRPVVELRRGSHFRKHAIERCANARGDGVEEPLRLRCCHFTCGFCNR
jgi:hypothetical protein